MLNVLSNYCSLVQLLSLSYFPNFINYFAFNKISFEVQNMKHQLNISTSLANGKAQKQQCLNYSVTFISGIIK